MTVKAVVNSQGLTFSVKVVPGASRTGVVGIEGDLLKVRLAAAPVDGNANRALIDLLAKVLFIPKSSIHLKSGLTSRRKTILLAKVDEARFRSFLADYERVEPSLAQIK